MVEANIIQIALTLIAVAVIGAMKFYERKYGNNPEAWDLQKFGMLVAVAIVVMAVEYLYGNAIAFPAEDIIVPAMALFGTAYTLITGGKLAKSVITANTTSAATNSWSPGFTVTPTFNVGKSPFTAKLNATVGMDNTGKRCSLKVDWKDGTPMQDAVVNPDGTAALYHTYEYVQGSTKYTSKSFYPAFSLIQSDGTTTLFNVTNKFCEVEVQSA